MYPFLIAFQFCLLYIILTSEKSSAVHYQYEACAPRSCSAYGPDISYPFIIEGSEAYCGYPGFVLNCIHGFPVLRLSDANDYIVDEIFYTNQSLRVHNVVIPSLHDNSSDFFFLLIRNTTLNVTRFNYVNSIGLHLFSNCSRQLNDRYYNISRCDGEDETRAWSVVMYDGDENLSNATSNCETNVIATVQRRADGNIDGFGEALDLLKTGVVLNWNASDCTRCSDSGGRCGFNETAGHFQCYCPTRPYLVSCPEGIGSMEFPFTNSDTRPDCGLFTVNCTSSPNPLLQLESGGTWYQILHKISPNKLSIRDTGLQNLLHRHSCRSFHNRSLPTHTTPFTSFAISPTFIVFTCFNVSNLNETNQNFQSHNCTYFMAYYRNPANTSVYNRSVVPRPCWAAELPMNPGQYTDNLFELISSDFTLQWNVSEECMSCHARGGQCSTNSMNEFFCRTADAVRKRTTLIIASALSGAGACIFLICLLAILIWLRKKRIDKLYIFSRTISSDPSSSKPDISDGNESFYYSIPIFSYSELEEATNNFDPSKELGDGGSGTVYHGKLRDGREVAIKRLFQHNYKRVEQFMNEIKILTCLKQQNLVTLYGCTSRTSSELLLVYEYVRNGTVADHLHKQRAKEAPLTWSVRMNIAIEAASALAYLHKSDIVHRDVKTSNILLDNNFAVKVADFGLSRLFPTDVTHISTAPQGTPGYVDPEYHRCYQLTDKSDVYSFGVVLIELVSSMPAVDITRHRDEINLATFALNRIQKGAFDDLIDPSLGYKTDAEIMRMTMSVAELAFQCLQMEKDMRPSMDEVSVFLVEIKKGGAEKIPLSPETDEVELLKNMKSLKSSPSAVTDIWTSGSTTASSIGYL